MAPPVTPSPRRFLPDTRSRPARQPYPSSSLRYQSATGSSSQFAPTPRFDFSSTKKHEEDVEGQNTSPLAARPRRPPSFRPTREGVEDVDDDDDDGPLSADDIDQEEMLLDTVEFDTPPHKRQRTEMLPPSHTETPLRQDRRKEKDPILISSSPDRLVDFSPSVSPPPVPASPMPRTPQHTRPRPGPMFTAPTPMNLAAPTSTRPHFVLPPPEQPQEQDLLPPVFSPHRRGQRFVPGGMASTVRDWLVDLNTGGGEAQTLSHLLGLRNARDSVNLRIVSLLRGTDVKYLRIETNAGDKWLLLGDGGLGLGSGSSVRVGDAVAVSLPVWELRLEGNTYRVAVNWSAVNPG